MRYFSPAGAVLLKDLTDDLGIAEINHICTAEIYDELFHHVRVMVRCGKTNEEIQDILDSSFSDDKLNCGVRGVVAVE